MITLIDSSVLLDVLTEDRRWATWSSAALADAADAGPVAINPIVYAEISAGFDRIEDLDDAVPESEIIREPLPWDAGFLAAKAYLAYRRRGGERRCPLPDLSIGAHAAVRGHRLLTRDAARYRTCFPSVEVIAP